MIVYPYQDVNNVTSDWLSCAPLDTRECVLLQHSGQEMMWFPARLVWAREAQRIVHAPVFQRWYGRGEISYQGGGNDLGAPERFSLSYPLA
jgi:hypothetical protein